MKKVLITGSTGLVGSEAVHFFTEKGWEVIGLDNNMRSYFFGTPKKTPQYDIDIRNREMINDLFEAHKFDAIIHAAAQPSHDWAKNDPLTDFHVNATGTLNLLEAARQYCPEAVFVHVSTDKVYGENMQSEGHGTLPDKAFATWTPALVEKETRYHSDYPFKESLGLDFAGQRSLFGCSKTAADIYVQEYGNYFGMKTACFRLGCITGKQHEGAEYHGFLAYLVKAIKEGIPYKIFGYKGKQVRDQIHAYDLVNAFYCFIQKPKSGAVYNLGGGPDRSVSILEAIKIIEEKTGKKAITEYALERKGDRQWDVHDVSKFRRDYPGWDYEYSLDDIFNDLCQ
jgi:CDP-paratose 2-epimerase